MNYKINKELVLVCVFVVWGLYRMSIPGDINKKGKRLSPFPSTEFESTLSLPVYGRELAKPS
jgi:hypothetical protein